MDLGPCLRSGRRWAALLTALLLLAAVAGPAAAGAAEKPADGTTQDRIDTFVSDYLDRHGLPGAAVTVVQGAEVVHEAGYGHDSDGEEITADTPLRIASVSKSFTAFAVLQLVGSGEVDLDQPVIRYLPEFALDDARVGQITVRHLLSQTSGLPSPVIVPPAADLEQAVGRMAGWQLSSDPGGSYRYSNANYWTAARLVEVVSGQPFDDYLRRQVFVPLAMTDSATSVTSRTHPAGVLDGHVTAYGRAIAVPELESVDAGAGGVVSTAADMGRWLAMQQREGVTASGERLLPAELVRESHTRQPGADRYGLGWVNSGPDVSPARVSHSGVITGFNAQQDLVPSMDLGVVVMLNSFTTTLEHAYEISSGIITIMGGGEPELGLPTAIISDLVLGALTLLVLALGARGVRRGAGWADRRRERGLPRFALRLAPQLIVPTLAVLVFAVVPNLQNNSATAADAFRLYPAAMALLIAGAVAGSAVTVTRVVARARGGHPGPAQPDTAAQPHANLVRRLRRATRVRTSPN